MPASRRSALEANMDKLSLCFLIDSVHNARTDEVTTYHYVFRESVPIETQSRAVPFFVSRGVEFFSFSSIDESYAEVLDGKPEKPGRFKLLTGI